MATNRIDWKIRKTGDGSFEGFVTLPVGLTQLRAAARGLAVPTGGKRLALKATGDSRAAALESAASLADQILSNPLVRDILPPGTNTAISAIKMLSKGALAGKLGKVLGKIKGPGLKRLGKALSKFF